MKIALITTHQVGRGDVTALNTLLRSVESSRHQDLCITHFVLLQGASELPTNIPQNLETIYILNGELVSLSLARNIILSTIGEKICDFDIVGFPDDDAWFPENFISTLSIYFSKTSEYIITRRHPEGLREVESANEFALDAAGVIKEASSNSMFASGRLVHRVGGFDQRIGVGTPCPGGEDTDYALRLLHEAKHASLLLGPRVAHNDFKAVENNKWARRKRYWQGETLVALKHISWSWGCRYKLLRCLLIGQGLAIRGMADWKYLVKPLNEFLKGQA